MSHVLKDQLIAPTHPRNYYYYKKKMAEIPTVEVTILCILIIILVIFVSLALAAYKKNTDCQSHPNIWCWSDYKCPYSTTPWVGVTGVYTPLNTACNWPGGPTGTSPPANCPCTWANGTASNVCNITGRPNPVGF